MSADRTTDASGQQRHALTGPIVVRWLLTVLIACVTQASVHGQDSEPFLPRPGAVLVTELIGQAIAVAGEKEKALNAEERVRVGSTIRTERLSLVTLILSNGATLRIGSESELEIEEFGQATDLNNVNFADLTEEPTVSRTRLRLNRGDVMIEVKPLNESRGSSFMLTTAAGTVSSAGGQFHARVRMSDLGLGVCTLKLGHGEAEFEIMGGKVIPVPPGRQLVFALERDPATGVIKVNEMPKEPADTKRTK